MRGAPLLLSLLLASGCFIDAVGNARDEGAGGASTSAGTTAGGGANDGVGGGASTTTGGMGGSSNVGGAGGGPPCNSQGALFDGLDDQLTFLPTSNIMSDSTDFKFQIRVEPASGLQDGTVFVAGRYDPLALQGWGLFLQKGAGVFLARAEIYQANQLLPCMALSTPIANFPAQLEVAFNPNTLTISANGATIATTTCSVNSLAGAMSEPFVVGGARAPFVTFRGRIDNIFYISNASAIAPCVSANPRDRGWDFEQQNGQLIPPLAGCSDDLVLGTDANETAKDPIIGCIP